MTRYLVCVYLAALARNLSRRYRPAVFDELDAAVWLRRPRATDDHHATPPFIQCDEWGVFWAKFDPRLLLEPDEILKCEAMRA